MVGLLVAAAAMAVQAPAIDTELAAAYFQEARALAAADSSRLWGIDLYGPMIFVHPGSGTAVTNREPPAATAGFEPVGSVWEGTAPPELGYANSAVEWSGTRWTMLIWPLPSNRYARTQLLMHELFHRVQPELGMLGQSPANEHLDEEEARVLLRLELRALEEALLRSDEEREAAIRDALRFRAERRVHFPGSAVSEAELELNEGLAAYTGLVASGLPRSVLADRAAVLLSEYDGRDSFSRSFAYASGPAYGILLDETGSEWRESLTPTSDLGDLLAEALDLNVAASRTAAHEASRDVDRPPYGAPYGERRLRDSEAERARRLAERRASLEARFVTGPTLSVPAGDGFRYSFDPNDALALPGEGIVYTTATVRGEWGTLSVTDGVLLVRRDGRVVSAAVPAPAVSPSPPHSGDGWELTLEEGWTVEARAEGGWAVVKGGE